MYRPVFWFNVLKTFDTRFKPFRKKCFLNRIRAAFAYSILTNVSSLFIYLLLQVARFDTLTILQHFWDISFAVARAFLFNIIRFSTRSKNRTMYWNPKIEILATLILGVQHLKTHRAGRRKSSLLFVTYRVILSENLG